ncbi:MAG: hypothetical protein ACK5LS_13880 [Propioniciclava sp.]
MRINPIYVVFPVAACLPYMAPFFGLVQDRFLVYARLRASTRRILAGHLLACGAMSGLTFALVGAIPGLWMRFGQYTLEPLAYGLTSPEAVRAAELSAAPLTNVVAVGHWALPVVYGLWVGINAAMYATISLCLILLQSSTIIALIAPWAVEMVAGFGLESLRWEEISTGLFMPFNLSQIPVTNFLFPLTALACVTLGFLLVVLVRADSLHRLQ